MKISYDPKAGILYVRIDEERQELINERISEEIVLDIGKMGKLVGIEILIPPKKINFKKDLSTNPFLTNYDSRTDILTIKFYEEPKNIIRKRKFNNILLNIGDEDQILGIEISEASKKINLEKVLPLAYYLTPFEIINNY